MAERQGERVAADIAAELTGEPPPPLYAGEGHCYVEMGGGVALVGRGDFFAEPPRMEFTDAGAQYLESKRAFERERLTRWFGG